MTLNRGAREILRVNCRLTETDPYRIAHHSNYAVWAELALREMLTKAGLPLSYTVTEFHCKYKASALLGDDLDVMLRVQKQISENEYDFAFEMRGGPSNQVLTMGGLTVCLSE